MDTAFISQMIETLKIETLKSEGRAFLEEIAKNAFNKISKAYADKNWAAVQDYSGIMYAATHHLIGLTTRQQKRLERWKGGES